jgi:hypothetical protein
MEKRTHIVLDWYLPKKKMFCHIYEITWVYCDICCWSHERFVLWLSLPRWTSLILVLWHLNGLLVYLHWPFKICSDASLWGLFISMLYFCYLKAEVIYLSWEFLWRSENNILIPSAVDNFKYKGWLIWKVIINLLQYWPEQIPSCPMSQSPYSNLRSQGSS